MIVMVKPGSDIIIIMDASSKARQTHGLSQLSHLAIVAEKYKLYGRAGLEVIVIIWRWWKLQCGFTMQLCKELVLVISSLSF